MLIKQEPAPGVNVDSGEGIGGQFPEEVKRQRGYVIALFLKGSNVSSHHFNSKHNGLVLLFET